MVHSWGQHEEEVVQHHGLVIQVELDGLVVEFNVGDLRDDVFEMRLPPCLSGMGHHGQNGVVILFILIIKEDQLSPQMRVLSGTENLIKGVREKVIVVPWIAAVLRPALIFKSKLYIILLHSSCTALRNIEELDYLPKQERRGKKF